MGILEFNKIKAFIKLILIISLFTQFINYFYLYSTKKMGEYTSDIFYYGIQVSIMLLIFYFTILDFKAWALGKTEIIVRTIIIVLTYFFIKNIAIGYVFLIMLSLFPMD